MNIRNKVSGELASITTYDANGTIIDIVGPGNISAAGNVDAVNVNAGHFIGNGYFLNNLNLANAAGAYGDSNVAAFLTTYGSNTITTTGNIQAGWFIGNGSQLTGLPAGYSNANVVSFLESGNSTAISITGNVTTTANVQGAFILGNGSQLTGLPAGYSNANAASFLAAFGSNVISTTGNITATAFVGNGFTLTSTNGANVTGQVANALVAGTVYTAAQPNITSLGNLTSLSTSGAVTVDTNITANGVFFGNGSGLHSLNAANLVGAYSNANAAGFLAAMGSNVISTTGNITATAFVGNGYTLTLINGANVSGNVPEATIANTVTNPAQSNITSVGTLTSLSVAGAVVANSVGGSAGNLVMTGNVISTTANVITLDPDSANGGISGEVIVLGNLSVTGNLTYVDVSTAITGNLVWQAANNAATATAASGGGLAVGPAGASYATWLYSQPSNAWVSGIAIKATGGANIQGALTGATDGTFSGNVAANNIAVTWEANLGNVANVVITGGSNGQFLQTDGNGNVSFANAVTAIPAVYFTATSAGNNKTFANTVLASYVANTDITLFYNGVLLDSDFYTLSGDTITLNTPVQVGDSISVSRQFAGSVNNVTSSYGNANVATYLPTYTGNLGGNLVTGTSSMEFNGDGTISLNVSGVANVAQFTNAGMNVMGNALGYLGIPQLVLSANTTMQLSDNGKHYYATTAGGATQTITVPSNANVAFQIGSTVSVVLNNTGTVQLVPQAGVSLYVTGNATPGTRTLSPYSLVTMLKVDTNTWYVSGTGVS